MEFLLAAIFFSVWTGNARHAQYVLREKGKLEMAGFYSLLAFATSFASAVLACVGAVRIW